MEPRSDAPLLQQDTEPASTCPEGKNAQDEQRVHRLISDKRQGVKDGLAACLHSLRSIQQVKGSVKQPECSASFEMESVTDELRKRLK
jgi:hypothetical protein